MSTATRSFMDLGVEQTISDALAAAGISSPFPIQELTLPLALSGADIIGQARTGTGKTLAFGIPLLSRVDPDLGSVQALVIVPTRELCLQVTGDLNQAGVRKGVDVVAVYGGRAMEPQVEAIAAGAPVVVGTPGRLLDLLRRGTLRLGAVTTLVLDEADEMLDLGFLPDVQQLIEATAPARQTLLFSATMPSQVVALARRYMTKPTFLRADVEEVHLAPETTQHFFSCHRMDKPAVLARILQSPAMGLCVVFTRTKRMADILAEDLRERGVAAAPLHSDLRQEARERAMERFRSGKLTVLVATEVAARGLDISDVTHVVNYDCPDDEKMYLHRIGRTGRAGAAGVAITLALWNELARLEMIKRALDISVETHEVFSTSPILDELFALPAREARQTPAPRKERPAVQPAPERKPRVRTPSDEPAAVRSRSRVRRRDGRAPLPDGVETLADVGLGENTADEAPAAPALQTAPAAAAEAAAAPEGAPAERRVRVRSRSPREKEPQPADAASPTAPAPAQRSRRSQAQPSRPRPSRERPVRSRSAGGASSGKRSEPRPEPAVARGTGKPTLRRRLTVDHLP